MIKSQAFSLLISIYLFNRPSCDLHKLCKPGRIVAAGVRITENDLRISAFGILKALDHISLQCRLIKNFCCQMRRIGFPCQNVVLSKSMSHLSKICPWTGRNAPEISDFEHLVKFFRQVVAAAIAIETEGLQKLLFIVRQNISGDTQEYSCASAAAHICPTSTG